MRAESSFSRLSLTVQSVAVTWVVVCLTVLSGQAQDIGPEGPEITADSISTPEGIEVVDTVKAATATIAADTVKAPSTTVKADSVKPTQPPVLEKTAEVEGSEDLVIEVDQKQSQNVHKSLPLALLYSAVLPGSGEYYLRDRGHAKAFLLAEAGFWAALYIAFISQDSYLQSARNSASEYAGIDAASKNEKFLNTMASFRSYQEKQHRQDSYELAQILSGKRDRDYDIPMKVENDWDFGSSSNPQNTRNWKTFQSTLRYYRASKVAMSFAVGALALNRLGSLANTLHVYKRTSAKGLGLQLIPEIGPDQSGARLSLGF